MKIRTTFLRITTLGCLALGAVPFCGAQGGYELLAKYGQFRSNNDVLYYHLDVRVDPQEKRISGKNLVRFKMLKNDNRIQLDLNSRFEVEKILFGHHHLKFERQFGSVFIDFPEVLRKDATYDVEFYFSGNSLDRGRVGLFFTKDAKGRDWIYTTCQGAGASSWWPNKDQWQDEVEKMRISVAVPNELTDVSNGRLAGKADLGDGYTRWDWDVSYRINNYNVALNIGRYENFSNRFGDLTLDYFVHPENVAKAKTQFTQVQPMLKAFEHYFGEYPFKRDGYKLIEVPYLGMEHQSAIAYGNKFANGYLGKDFFGSGVGEKFDYIIVHESAHEWFGNSVSAAERSDTWIQEGWATYMESLYVEYLFGKEDAITYTNGFKSRVENEKPIVGERGMFAAPLQDMYPKGALFLNTLRSVFDDDKKWFRLIKGFYQKFKYRNIMTEDVVAYFNEKTGRDLTPIFDQYLRHPKLPILELSFHVPGEVSYRWVADEPGFNMPVTVREKGEWRTIKPTNQRQRMKTVASKDQFEVATDRYYIEVKK